MKLEDRWIENVRETLKDRHVCYVSLKGSRLLGVDEPGADVDLRVIHKDSTAEILSLHPPKHTVERSFYNEEGEDIDFVSYEVRRFMGHLQNHNGNQIESLLVPEGFYWADSHGWALREIAKRYVTKRLHRYYRGYAHGQFKRAVQQIKTGKGMMYTYREMYLGLWVLRHGEMIFDWTQLTDAIREDFGWESPVLNGVSMDRIQVDSGLVDRMQREFIELTRMLDAEADKSTLPETYDGSEMLSRKLLKWRSEGWM